MRENELENGVFDMEPLYGIFGKWLAIDDTTLLDILVGFWLAHRLTGDPIWLLLMGRSSDGKTELLRAFSSVDAVVVDKITPSTIVTGHKGTSDSDKLQKKQIASAFSKELNEQIWMVMDFSQILAMHPQDRKIVFSQMRDLYDGHLYARYGTGKKVKEERIYTSFIGATTPDLERYLTEQQALGTRHLVVRVPKQNKLKLRQRISDHEGKEDRMRAALNATIMGSFAGIEPQWIYPDVDTRKRIDELVDITCTLRTYVSYDKYHREVDEMPDTENIGRIKKNLDKFYAGLMNIEGYTPERALGMLSYIVKSNIPRVRLEVLEMLSQSETVRPSDLAKKLRIGYKTAERHIKMLFSLNVLDSREGGRAEYEFSKDWVKYSDWFKREEMDND